MTDEKLKGIWITCDGCGEARLWRGFKCLTVCACMAASAPDAEGAEADNV